ncbi:MAG TPA: preprotein translocase subunit YajC [Pedococcus sp.]|nr:preprotein translocase subunit YajC [Pedococcus sp.]
MSSGGSSASLLIFLLPVLLIGYMIFGQRRRQREVQSLQSTLEVGDEICTTSGMFGTVTGIEGTVIDLEIASGVTIRVDRRAIGSKVSPIAAPLDDTGVDADAPDASDSTE